VPRAPRRGPGRLGRAATFVLLLAGGAAALLCAVRLAAAALGSGLSPVGALGWPRSAGWQAVVYAALVVVSLVLLALVVGRGRHELWLAGPGGGILVPALAVGAILRDDVQEHDEVVRAEVSVRVRRGRPAATVTVDLRPLVDGDAVAAELGGEVRASLARITGVADVHVRVRPRVLTVKQLARRLP